ncbi:MAG: hypothetical protein R6V07_04825, partial [Armatimonadota bacterium]
MRGSDLKSDELLKTSSRLIARLWARPALVAATVLLGTALLMTGRPCLFGHTNHTYQLPLL